MVFIVASRPSLVVSSGCYSSLQCMGFSLRWLLLLQSRALGAWVSVVVAHGLSCSMAHGIFLDQGLNPCFLPWKADSYSVNHQGISEPPSLGYTFGSGLERGLARSCGIGTPLWPPLAPRVQPGSGKGLRLANMELGVPNSPCVPSPLQVVPPEVTLPYDVWKAYVRTSLVGILPDNLIVMLSTWGWWCALKMPSFVSPNAFPHFCP